MGSNREKSNIAKFLEITIFKGFKKIFRILMIAIIFSSIVQNTFQSVLFLEAYK